VSVGELEVSIFVDLRLELIKQIRSLLALPGNFPEVQEAEQSESDEEQEDEEEKKGIHVLRCSSYCPENDQM
jgi:hypothetical protein